MNVLSLRKDGKSYVIKENPSVSYLEGFRLMCDIKNCTQKISIDKPMNDIENSKFFIEVMYAGDIREVEFHDKSFIDGMRDLNNFLNYKENSDILSNPYFYDKEGRKIFFKYKKNICYSDSII